MVHILYQTASTCNLPSICHCRFLQVDIADRENSLWMEEEESVHSFFLQHKAKMCYHVMYYVCIVGKPKPRWVLLPCKEKTHEAQSVFFFFSQTAEAGGSTMCRITIVVWFSIGNKWQTEWCQLPHSRFIFLILICQMWRIGKSEHN